ncbi:LPS-assembly lipoprotein LptE [Endozoicomonadaceae bacterium StTr2]
MNMNRPTYLRALAGKRFFSGITVMLLTALMVGCGFQLRGQVNVPEHLKRLQVEIADRDFRTPFERQLILTGIEVSPAARYSIRVLKRKQESEIQSFGGSDRASEYLLTTRIRYQLETQDGIPLFGPYELQQTRRYLRDPNNYTSSKSEEALLFEELDREVIATMIRRISAISESDLAEAEKVAEELREKQKQEQQAAAGDA